MPPAAVVGLDTLASCLQRGVAGERELRFQLQGFVVEGMARHVVVRQGCPGPGLLGGEYPSEHPGVVVREMLPQSYNEFALPGKRSGSFEADNRSNVMFQGAGKHGMGKIGRNQIVKTEQFGHGDQQPQGIAVPGDGYQPGFAVADAKPVKPGADKPTAADPVVGGDDPGCAGTDKQILERLLPAGVMRLADAVLPEGADAQQRQLTGADQHGRLFLGVYRPDRGGIGIGEGRGSPERTEQDLDGRFGGNVGISFYASEPVYAPETAIRGELPDPWNPRDGHGRQSWRYINALSGTK